MKKLAMVFVFMPLMALAETWKEPDTGISWSYIVTNGTAMVTSVSGGSEVVIPSTLDGYRVTSIGTRAFSHCNALKNVTIPSSVTSIGVCAFADCAELTSVTIPEGVMNIGHGAFFMCGGLKSVTIPSSVTNIESGAFWMCESMTTISVALNNEMYSSSDGVLYDKSKTVLTQCPAGTEGKVVIPDGVASVGEYAFHTCKGVTSVTIPDSVMNIGVGAFFKCGGLKSVTIPSNVTNIEFVAFAQCGGLTSVMIPSSVTGIDDGAFSDCENLKAVDVFSGDEVERLSFDEFFKRQREMKKARFMEEFGRKRAQIIRAGSDSDSASIATGKRVVESTGTSIKREDFKAKLTGVAIIEGGRMCGFESRAQKADFQSPDQLIEVPYGKAACFRVEYDFPEGYQARVWTRGRWQIGDDGSSYYFGSNPSPLYKGKGIAYGFLDMLKRGRTCTLKRLAIGTYSEPKLEGLSREWDIAVTPVNIKFYGPETVQNTAAEDVASAVTNNTVKAEKISVAEKLETCDFLLNKGFKKNAKYYLCLFSASWCGPCRAEMPRIAKIYAETLKDDPDIELIHFSRDQNDDKAIAWAKEHDVKFPVVKPKGGNPLNLQSRGIPHLFILKADGTIVEHDHPMRIFNEEKFKEIKEGKSPVAAKSTREADVPEKVEGVDNVTIDGGLFTLTGPYGIRLTADPGCEKGAEYALNKLVGKYLPAAKEFYGDPFFGEKPSRTYSIDVTMNDGLGNSSYTGPSYRPGTGSWHIGLSKGAQRYEMSLDYLASSVLTVCEEPQWASFVFYVNKFVEAKAKGIDPTPRLKEDIRKGLEEADDESNKWLAAHAPLWAMLEDLRANHPKLIIDYCNLKNKRFAEGKLQKKLSLAQMASLLGEVTGEDAAALFEKYGVKAK